MRVPRAMRSLQRRRADVAEAVPAAAPQMPMPIVAAGAWAWRLLAIAGALAVVVLLVISLRAVVVPLLVSVLIASLLVPFVAFLRRHRWPRWSAILFAEALFIAAISALVYLVVTQVYSGFSELQSRALDSWDDLRAWLLGPPFEITQADLDYIVEEARAWIEQNVSSLLSSAFSVTSAIGGLLAGIVLVAFITLFLLVDGRGIWGWTVRLLPRVAQPAVTYAGDRGWFALVNFVRAQVLVATIDAIGIGLGAALLGLPLAIPIAVLVFLGSFIPFLGAILTGAFAVFVALVFSGVWQSVIMLLIVLAVQQLEGNVLQPLIMGSAVKVHPLAVVLAVTTGTLLAGIPGALFAVPVVAIVNTMVRAIASGEWRENAPPLPSPATHPTRRKERTP